MTSAEHCCFNSCVAFVGSHCYQTHLKSIRIAPQALLDSLPSVQCAHTMGFLLLPGGLNEKVIKKISRNEVWEQRVQPLLAELAVERDPRVLLCHDGFGRNAERDAAYQIFFLKKFLGQNADVRTFSFTRTQLQIML